MESAEFQEVQRFNQNWLYLLVTAIAGLMLFAVYQEFGDPSSWSQLNSEDAGALAIIGSTMLILFALFFIRLNTVVNEQGISIKFWPFIINYRMYKWTEIDAVEVCKYSPVREFLGWGIRYNGKTWAYTIKGSHGIRIKLTDGKNVLVGTQRPQEMEAALGRFGNFA